MGDVPVDSEIVEIANEYRRLQRQLEAKTAQLAALTEVNAEAGQFPVEFEGALNQRYSIDFTFKPGVLEPQELPVQVKKGTIFRCKYVESWVRAVGTVDQFFTDPETPVTLQATMSWAARLASFDYLWRVRDTGTDREWVDRPQPSLFFGGGYVGPRWLPRRNILSGGTVIYATIDPFLSSLFGAGFFDGDASLQEYIVQMSFVGHEVPDGSVL